MQPETYDRNEGDYEGFKNILRKFVDIDSKLSKRDLITITFFIILAIIAIIGMIRFSACTLDCAMCPGKAAVTIGWT